MQFITHVLIFWPFTKETQAGQYHNYFLGLQEQKC